MKIRVVCLALALLFASSVSAKVPSTRREPLIPPQQYDPQEVGPVTFTVVKVGGGTVRYHGKEHLWQLGVVKEDAATVIMVAGLQLAPEDLHTYRESELMIQSRVFHVETEIGRVVFFVMHLENCSGKQLNERECPNVSAAVDEAMIWLLEVPFFNSVERSD